MLYTILEMEHRIYALHKNLSHTNSPFSMNKLVLNHQKKEKEKEITEKEIK